MYHPLYTYNLISDHNSGSYWGDGFHIVQENGCPIWNDFYDPVLYDLDKRYLYWMTGFPKYEDAMKNTISKIYQFEFGTSLINLNYRKHWISDHGVGALTGGLLTFSVYAETWADEPIPIGSPHAGDRIITQFGSTGSHALTIVGYNDDIWALDINGDGNYTTNVDVNNDFVVDVRDQEKGAYYCVNSWGTGSGTLGYFYVPYCLLWTLSPEEPAPGLTFCHAYSCEVFENPTVNIPEPEITIRTNMSHLFRTMLFFSVGYGDIDVSTPDYKTDLFIFNTEGGYHEMRGAYTGPIEIGLNFSHYYTDLPNSPFQKIYFSVTEDDQYNSAPGQINSVSLVDHRWNEEFVLPFPIEEPPMPINNDTETILSVEYFLLPHHDDFIIEDESISTNRVSRFTTSVTNNSTLTLEQDVKIDMYSSEINIDAGCALAMSTNSIITAKRGFCKVIIEGNFQSLGNNINFIAEDGAVLDIYFNNLNTSNTVQNVVFNKCNIYGHNEALTFSGCTFTNCKYIQSDWGNITFASSNFTNCGLYLDNSSRNTNYRATVTSCTFNNNISGLIGINLSRYGCYNISGNTLSSYCDGIQVNNSGAGISGNQKIEYNTIHSCEKNGIIAYNSIGSIYRNNIYNNYHGVRFMNNCSFALHGDPNAVTIDQTQQISNNLNCEVYSSEFSFPYYFRYNSIVDPDNAGKPNDPLVWFDRPVYAQTTKAHVEYCHWGAGFNGAQDLMGNNVIWLTFPEWTPQPIPTVTPDQELYSTASSYFAEGNYQLAKSQYQLLIELYPRSPYAEAAMKDLVRLEEYAGKDYMALKEYFLTNDSINADTALAELAEISANECDVRDSNYETAIDWYENRILTADNTADSIFAVIDLGFVYLLMEEDGARSNYIGKLPEFKPGSKPEYLKNKAYLLDLLPEIKTSKMNTGAGMDESFIQNFPNPANEFTQFSFSTYSKANITVKLIDNMGRIIRTYGCGVKEEGTHKLDISTTDLPSGLYFYSLYADGKLLETNKMSIVR